MAITTTIVKQKHFHHSLADSEGYAIRRSSVHRQQCFGHESPRQSLHMSLARGKLKCVCSSSFKSPVWPGRNGSTFLPLSFPTCKVILTDLAPATLPPVCPEESLGNQEDLYYLWNSWGKGQLIHAFKSNVPTTRISPKSDLSWTFIKSWVIRFKFSPDQFPFHLWNGGKELRELRRKEIENKVLSGRGNDLWISGFALGGCLFVVPYPPLSPTRRNCVDATTQVWGKHVLHHPYHSNPSAAPLFANHQQGETHKSQQGVVISQEKSLKVTRWNRVEEFTRSHLCQESLDVCCPLENPC